MGEEQFGKYRLDRLLGRGGMGEVWLARDTGGGHMVALKVLSENLAADGEYRRRFEREARLGSTLRNPHIVRIHGFGEQGGRLFIAMDYIDGIDLAEMLGRVRTLTPVAAVDFVTQVASGLDAAHRAGLIHRDVKPSNILIDSGGHAYLIDFGIAKGIGQTAVTATGMAIGSWPYMAPERFNGTVDARSDIYSLACVLYECLTGRRPYGDTDPPRQMHDHLMASPPCAASVNPAVPTALDAVIACGMAKDQARRYPSARDFADAARAAVGLERPSNPPVHNRSAVPPVPPQSSPQPGRRPPHSATPSTPPSPKPRTKLLSESGPTPTLVATGQPAPSPSPSAEPVAPNSSAAPATPDPRTRLLPEPEPTLATGQPVPKSSPPPSGKTVASSDSTVEPSPALVAIGQSPSSVAPKHPLPTKVTPEPGPTVAAGESSSPASAKSVASSTSASESQALVAGGQSPASVAPKHPTPTKVMPESGLASALVAAGESSPPASAKPVASSTSASESQALVAGGQSPASVAPKHPTPTKVMPEPGPTPTLVVTRLAPQLPPAPVRGAVPQQNSRYAPHAPVRRPGAAFPPPSVPAKRSVYQRSSKRPRSASVAPIRWSVSRGRPWIAPPAPALPRRRPRRRSGGVFTKVIGALVVVFLTPFVFAAGCVALLASGSRVGDPGGGSSAPPPTASAEEHPAPPPDPDQAAPAPAQSPVRDGKFEFVVTSADSGVSRVGFQSARGSFEIITVTVNNISDQSKWFLPFGQRLVDTQGRRIDHDPAATMWQTTQQWHNYSFELRPGQSATTQLVFDVAPDATPSHLELHDFPLSQGVTVMVN
ncbi:protein kinase [Nocardia sp. GCM10030253]|uniref:serine/threonine-protein kinase n=1 Tax=Nocardia sp. GCM10030253 TaxID=3273404 RepID=UPI0036435C21